MNVSDLMTKEVVWAKPTDNIVKVAELLHKKGLNGVPVVENGKVLGMITEADLVSRGPTSFHIPSLVKILHDLKLEKYLRNKRDEGLCSVLGANAESIMNVDFTYVAPDAEITELIRIFREKHVNPIPVIDKEKNLAGIVSLADIVKLISRFREEELNFLEHCDGN